ncbi:MAG: hypothetical protein A2099_06825 [Planctomycetes bacterium GWF2_39_10]|nr:MAG: hypothetical protein A2Y09_00405 [Planctomycetes bacterium GWA2_39_15]OHB48279.1 MAG: hypothetical protein A2099_06825 [Planctomycetes bacterium GWF2_39_10]
MKLLIRSLLFCIIFFVGCAHYLHPNQVPPISVTEVASYQENLSVNLINDQPDTTPNVFVGKFYVNYNEWTQFFIDSYSAELTKRGVKVSKDSPNKIKVKLSGFNPYPITGNPRVNIVVQLSSIDDKWYKIYRERDFSGWSWGRAFGSVVYHTIEKLLKDPELLNRMKTSDVK